MLQDQESVLNRVCPEEDPRNRDQQERRDDLQGSEQVERGVKRRRRGDLGKDGSAVA